MDNLRLILLVLGALLIGGIYLFETHRRRRAERSRQLREAALEPPAAPAGPEVEADPDVLFQGLERFTSDDGGDPDMGDLASLVAESPEGVEAPGDGAADEVPPSDEGDTPAAAAGDRTTPEPDPGPAPDPEPGFEPEPAEMPSGPELIIALTVMARGTERFEGVRLGQALESVGMKPGDMKIYHCAGTGDRPSRRPVFSAASVLEPGTLDPADFEDFSTTGIVLFMRVGGRTDGSVVFELMLNTGQRLAKDLGGELCDDTRSSLTNQSINHIRERISDHARRRMIGSV